MAPEDETRVAPSTLDALIRLAKKVSLLTGLMTGLGLLALYFVGIARPMAGPSAGPAASSRSGISTMISPWSREK